MKVKARLDEGKHCFQHFSVDCCFQLLNPPAYDEEIENMLDRFEWVFLPVSNVDGFSFTHEVSNMNIRRP